MKSLSIILFVLIKINAQSVFYGAAKINNEINFTLLSKPYKNIQILRYLNDNFEKDVTDKVKIVYMKQFSIIGVSDSYDIIDKAIYSYKLKIDTEEIFFKVKHTIKTKTSEILVDHFKLNDLLKVDLEINLNDVYAYDFHIDNKKLYIEVRKDKKYIYDVQGDTIFTMSLNNDIIKIHENNAIVFDHDKPNKIIRTKTINFLTNEHLNSKELIKYKNDFVSDIGRFHFSSFRDFLIINDIPNKTKRYFINDQIYHSQNSYRINPSHLFLKDSLVIISGYDIESYHNIIGILTYKSDNFKELKLDFKDILGPIGNKLYYVNNNDIYSYNIKVEKIKYETKLKYTNTRTETIGIYKHFIIFKMFDNIISLNTRNNEQIVLSEINRPSEVKLSKCDLIVHDKISKTIKFISLKNIMKES